MKKIISFFVALLLSISIIQPLNITKATESSENDTSEAIVIDMNGQQVTFYKVNENVYMKDSSGITLVSWIEKETVYNENSANILRAGGYGTRFVYWKTENYKQNFNVDVARALVDSIGLGGALLSLNLNGITVFGLSLLLDLNYGTYYGTAIYDVYWHAYNTYQRECRVIRRVYSDTSKKNKIDDYTETIFVDERDVEHLDLQKP